MITRRDVIGQAIHGAYRKMYKMSQPSADYDELVQKVKSGEIDEKETPVYMQHYLPRKVREEIIEEYASAYGIEDKWEPYVDIVLNYLQEGGTKDKYIERDGDRPGYRGYEKTPKLEDAIPKEYADKCIELINDCKEFYRLDSDYRSFEMEMALGASPVELKDKVIEYWASKGVDIVIDDSIYDDEDDYDFEEDEQDNE